MWEKQSDTLIMGLNNVSIRFHCPNCGTLNTFLDLSIPESNVNYDNLSESDSNEDTLENCVNEKCTEDFNISLTNAADGLLIQVDGIADNDIEYK